MIRTLEMRLALYKGSLRALEMELHAEMNRQGPRSRYFLKYLYERLKSVLDLADSQAEGLSYID